MEGLSSEAPKWINLSENSTTYSRYAECMFDHMYPPRMISMVVLSLVLAENMLLLLAVIVHWPKFHSNLYRFITSLICSDILVAVSNMSVLILKSTNAGSLYVTSFLKGASYVSFVVSTLSLSFINVSARLTFARSGDRLAQVYKLDNTSFSIYFRKEWIVNLIIVGIWGFASILTLIAVMTGCTKQEHDCVEDCATILLDSSGEQQVLCRTSACSRFFAPLSIVFVLLLNVVSWCGFVFLITTTVLVVCMRVEIVPVTPKRRVSVTNGSRNRISPTNEESAEDLYAEKKSHVAKNTPLPAYLSKIVSTEGETSLGMKDIGDNAPAEESQAVFAVRRCSGLNRDFLARFSLTVTCLQLIFWVPVTALTLRGFILQSSYTDYYRLEMINNVFFVPSLLDPWVLVITMSKLRDAIFSTYFGRWKCYTTRSR